MCSKNYCNEKIDKNFVEIINILNSNNIQYWLCHGTLLGIIRDDELIPWDHDIDIAVWYNKNLKKKFIDLMKENNFKLKIKYLVEDDLLTFIKPGGREVDINFYEKKILNKEEFAYVKWYVPKNSIMKLIEAISNSKNYYGKYNFIINKLFFLKKIFKKIKLYFVKKNYFYKTIGYTQPLKLLKEFKEIKFKNISVSVPYFAEDYLEYVYGRSWKKITKNYNWIKDSPSTRKI